MRVKMMLTVVLPSLLSAGVADAAPRPVPAAIDAVTVFPREAMVVRRARTQLVPGTNRLKIPGLPARMRDDSVRVIMGGAARPLLTGFSVERVPLAEQVSPEARALEEKLRGLNRRRAQLRRSAQRLKVRTRYLKSMRSRFEQKLLVKAAKSQVDTRTWAQAETFLGDELARIAGEARQIRVRRRRLRRQLRLVRQQIAQIRSKRSKLTKALLVDVRTEAGGEAEIEVRYQVPQVSWRSLYDARLAGRRVRLTHYALVVQRSGEDWNNVRLAVSTAKTGRRIAVPRLRARNLRVARYGTVATGDSTVALDKVTSARNERASRPGGPPPPPPPAPEAEARRSEYVTTYEAATRVSIPSSPSGRKTPIAVLRFETKLEHVAVPKRTLGSFLTAVGRLGQAMPLPEGQVSLYFGGEYVGRTSLAQVVPGGKVRLPFGRDERVRVRRQLLLRKRHEQGVFTKEERWDYRYRIRVKNNSPRAVSLTVLDQIPNSQHEDIKVELAEDTTPRAKRRPSDAPGVLRWKLELAPRQEQTIKLGFAVTSPRGKRVWGRP